LSSCISDQHFVPTLHPGLKNHAVRSVQIPW
jgi:hypothetical protein